MRLPILLALALAATAAHALDTAGTHLLLVTGGTGTDDFGNVVPTGDSLDLPGDGSFLPSLLGTVEAGGGFGYGYAVLDTGKIGVYAKSEKSSPFYMHNMPYSTQADATLWETIQIVNPTEEEEYVTFGIHVDGFFSDAKPNRPPWEWSAWADMYAFLQTDTYVQNVNRDTTGHWSVDMDLGGGFWCPPGASTHFVKYGLAAHSTDGATSDFSHTLTPHLLLPDGFTMTSSSGRFLRAVPEPSAFAPLTLGLLALARRRRR